jgi:hypothetical protein
MKTAMRNWIWASFIVTVFMVTAVVLWPYRFRYNSFCTKCGAVQYTTEWQFPGSDWTFFSHSTVTATPLSRYLSSSALVSAHQHNWLFGHGGGNGVRCALGSGDRLRTAVNFPETIRFLEVVKKYGGENQSERFLRLALNPDSTDKVLTLAALVPKNGFSNREQYQSWISENIDLVDGTLATTEKNP